MKKIVLISNKVFHYRVSIYNYLNLKLQDIGYELIVMTNEVQNKSPHSINFKIIIMKFGFLRYRKKISQLHPYAIIYFLHLKDIFSWPLSFWVKFRTEIKTIYWNHGVNLQDPDNKLKNMMYSVFHRNSDVIILYSENEIKFVSPKFSYKLFIANNTLNFNDFPHISKTKIQIRKEYGIDFKKVVLFSGRIVGIKKLDDLLDIIMLLDDNIGVVIVGDGASEEQLQKINNNNKISYFGEVYDLYKISSIFKMSDVFCIPGCNGLSLNQAFYWGLPAVTEDVCHSPEIIYLKNNYNGFIVPNGNLKILANKINILLSSPETYSAFSAAAEKEIMNNGNIEKMFNGFASALKFLETNN